MWFNTIEPLLVATWETLYMVFLASVIGIIAGLALGVLIFLTQREQIIAKPWLNKCLGIVVNIVRSIPFIILMICLIPFMRFAVGTSIGTNAAIIPLTIAAIAFYARVSEASLAEVPAGLLEAARAMGASRWQFVMKFLLPEARAGLIKGMTLTVIGLIGYSAMAGAIGGGGLGELAINYGYQQFNIEVMLLTVIVLIILVQGSQSLGDYLAKQRQSRSAMVAIALVFVLMVGSQFFQGAVATQQTLKVGIMSGVQQKVMAVAKRVAAKDYGLNIKLVPFSDYMLPNEALNDGSIDANIFQHVPYLKAQIKARGYAITPIAKTFVYPMGFYSIKIKSLDQLKSGAVIALPNDPSNEGRALRLLAQHGVIKLKPGVGILGTVRDITSNPKQLQFKLIAAAQVPRVMQDITLGAITNDYINQTKLSVDDAIIKEGADSPYANVIVVRTADKHNPLLKQLILVMHSPQVLKIIQKIYPNGGAIVAWQPPAKTPSVSQ